MKRLILAVSVPVVSVAIVCTLTLLPVQRTRTEHPRIFENFSIDQTSTETALELWYSARTGDSLFYREYAGNSPLQLILIHGSGSEGRYLRGLGGALHERLGITVILPDLRGHGRSMNGQPGDINYIGQLEDDLVDLQATLKQRRPGTRIILGGHSSGGGLTVRLGGSRQGNFDGYLLLAPYLGHRSPVVRPASGGWVQVSVRRYAGLGILNTVGLRWLNHLPVLFFNRPDEFIDNLQVDSYSYRLNESISPRDYEDDLAQIKDPIMVIVGASDQALYADRFESLFEANAPQADIAVVVSGHLDVVDDPLTFATAVEWLKLQLNAP